MGATTADVRRDIELTRERMSSTIAELEQKLNVVQAVCDHPSPAIALAVGVGLVLSGSGADVKAAEAAAGATRGVRSRAGAALDTMVAALVRGVQQAMEERLNDWVDDVKGAIASPRRRPPAIPPRAD